MADKEKSVAVNGEESAALDGKESVVVDVEESTAMAGRRAWRRTDGD